LEQDAATRRQRPHGWRRPCVSPHHDYPSAHATARFFGKLQRDLELFPYLHVRAHGEKGASLTEVDEAAALSSTFRLDENFDECAKLKTSKTASFGHDRSLAVYAERLVSRDGRKP
jgi:hypothetical protein